MVCGGCRKNRGTHPGNNSGDLRNYAFLSPRQLRLRKKIEEDLALQKQSDEESKL